MSSILHSLYTLKQCILIIENTHICMCLLFDICIALKSVPLSLNSTVNVGTQTLGYLGKMVSSVRNQTINTHVTYSFSNVIKLKIISSDISLNK